MNDELIPIKDGEGGEVVNARDLYEFLEIQARFNDWCLRMFEYGFVEGKDFYSFLSKSIGGRPSTEYALTVACAKHIAMIQRSEKGRQARDYFLEIEKRYKAQQPAPLSDDDLISQALVVAHRILAKQNDTIKELAPKAQYTDEVLTSVSDWTTTTIAKELGISAKRLNEELKRLGVQFKGPDGNWLLYSPYASKGYTNTRTTTYTDHTGQTHSAIITVWTEAGRKFIHQVLNHRLTSRLHGGFMGV